LLSKPLESKGVLAFARPDRLRWEVTSPAPSLFVVDGTKVGMAYPQLGVSDEIDLAAQPDMARLTRALTVWLGADLDTVLADYTLAWQDGPPAMATLTPRDPTLGKLMANLELTITGDPPRVEQVRIVEPDGDSVEIRLQEVHILPSLPPETFRLTP